MRDIINDCPHCGARFEVSDQEIGLRWPCPHCQKLVVIKAPKFFDLRNAGRDAERIVKRFLGVLLSLLCAGLTKFVYDEIYSVKARSWGIFFMCVVPIVSGLAIIICVLANPRKRK